MAESNEMLTQSMKLLLDGFVKTSDPDETVNEFMKISKDKVIPSRFEEMASVVYRDSKINYAVFESDFDEKIMDYIKKSENPKKYLNILNLLMQDSYLLVHKIQEETAEIIKPAESEYTKLGFLIVLDKEFEDEEKTEIVSLIVATDMYINGYIDDDTYVSIVDELK